MLRILCHRAVFNCDTSFIVKTFYQNGECSTEAVRKLRIIFGRNKALYESTVRRLVIKFETTGSVLTVKSPRRKRSRRTEEQLVFVQDSAIASPGKSICRRLQQLNIPTSLLHRILHKDFHMHAYKIQLTQNVKLAAHGRRRRFAD